VHGGAEKQKIMILPAPSSFSEERQKWLFAVHEETDWSFTKWGLRVWAKFTICGLDWWSPDNGFS